MHVCEDNIFQGVTLLLILCSFKYDIDKLYEGVQSLSAIADLAKISFLNRGLNLRYAKFLGWVKKIKFVDFIMMILKLATNSDQNYN